MTRFYLFGETIVSKYQDEGFENVMETIRTGEFCDYDTLSFTDGDNPSDLLNTADGWGKYCEIKEVEYKIINNQLTTLVLLNTDKNEVHVWPIPKNLLSDTEAIEDLIIKEGFILDRIFYQASQTYPRIFHHPLLEPILTSKI